MLRRFYKKTIMKPLNQLFYLIFILLISSCSNKVERLYEKGKNEDVIEQVIKREKKHQATKSEIELAEKAYSDLQDDLIRQIEVANEEEDEEKWIKIYNLSNRLEKVQNMVKSAGTLEATNGYIGQFEFVDLGQLKGRAEEEAFSYYQNLGDEKLKEAEDYNDKEAAREAYNYYEKALVINKSKDIVNKQKTARDLGVVRIYKQIGSSISFGPVIGNQSNRYREFDRDLNSLINIQNSFWVEEVRNTNFKMDNVDYVVWLGIQDIDVNTNSSGENKQEYSKDITVESTNSNGQTVTTTQTVRATVSKTKTEKVVDVALELQISAPNNFQNQFVRNYYQSAKEIQEKCTIYGDKRALPSGTTCSSKTTNFSSDSEMTREAIRQMRSSISSDLNRELKDIIN